MVDLADLAIGMRVLEPSAGTGRLLEAMPGIVPFGQVRQTALQVVAVEVNLSCPNLEGRRGIFAHDPELSAAVIEATAACGRPRWAKLSANTDRVVEVAAAVHDAGGQQRRGDTRAPARGGRSRHDAHRRVPRQRDIGGEPAAGLGQCFGHPAGDGMPGGVHFQPGERLVQSGDQRLETFAVRSVAHEVALRSLVWLP